MEDIWQQTPPKTRQTEALLKPYISGLMIQGEYSQAIAMIEQFLTKNWSDALVYQYGQIPAADLLKRLATAEKWLKHHEENPWLLLTLGRLALANQLWAKAEAYLRESLEHGPRAETYQALADGLMAQDKRDTAATIYRQGLEIALKNGQ